MSQSDSHQDYNSYIGKDLSLLVILSTLRVIGPKKFYSAYEIIRIIKEKTNGMISLRAGTIYPQMDKLEEKGYLVKRIEDTPSRSVGVTRQRSVYSLTEKGMQQLNKKRRDWLELQHIINLLLQDE